MRRGISFFLSLWLVLFGTIVPMSQVHAFVWSPGLGVRYPPPPGGSAAVTALSFIPRGGPVVALGTVILAFCIQNGTWVCFKPTGAADDQQVVDPSGAATDQTSPTTLVYRTWNNGAEATVTSGCDVSCSQQASYAVSVGQPNAACQYVTSFIDGQTNYQCYGHVAGGGTSMFMVGNKNQGCISPAVLSGGVCHTYSCPTGTTLQGTQCVGTPHYVSDGSPTLRVAPGGGAWQTESKDPDSVGGTVSAPLSVTGDEEGNHVASILTPLSDGGIKVDKYVQTFNGGNTTTAHYEITVNNAGNVTNSNVTQTFGTIQQAQAGTAAPALQLPDDYNREATQLIVKEDLHNLQTETKADREAADSSAVPPKAAAVDAVGSVGPPGHVTGGRWDSGGLGLPEQSDYEAPDVSGAAGWASEVSCSPLETSWLGRSMELNYCPLVAIVRPLFEWAMIAGASISALRWVLTRREEEA